MLQVLVVDDDLGLLESLSCALRDEFEVSTARTAEEAWDRLQALHPELLLLDQDLPGMSGLGLLERLNQGHPPAAVMLSAGAGIDMARQAIRMGAQNLLSKPCDIGILKRHLREAATAGRYWMPESRPFALRAARLVEEACLDSGAGGLAQRSQRLTRRLMAEAISDTAGNRDEAALRLEVSVIELDRGREGR